MTEGAYAWCERFARGHYENFPVGSLLVPRRLRRHVVAIYAFARIADDIADEPGDDRLGRLAEWEDGLRDAANGLATHPALIALGASIRDAGIPIEPLRDLLKAFRHDAEGAGFGTVEDLLEYCTRSANPVGRLILHLYGLADPLRIASSDAMCTALQITNFLQDLSVDLPRARFNVPSSIVAPATWRAPRTGIGEIERGIEHLGGLAQRLFAEGAPLLGMIPDVRLRLELRATWLGGTRVLALARRWGIALVDRRPSLRATDRLALLARALLWKSSIVSQADFPYIPPALDPMPRANDNAESDRIR